MKLKGEAAHFLLIPDKQVDRQRFRTQDQGNKSHWFTHPDSNISCFVYMARAWTKWWRSTGHGSFLHRECLKNDNYYSDFTKKSVTTKLLLAVAHGFLFVLPPAILFCCRQRRRLETNGGNSIKIRVQGPNERNRETVTCCPTSIKVLLFTQFTDTWQLLLVC